MRSTVTALVLTFYDPCGDSESGTGGGQIMIAVFVKFAVAIILFLPKSTIAAAAAEWEKVVQVSHGSVFIQTTTLSRNGRLASATTLVNYTMPNKAFNGNSYRSSLSRTVFDCGKKKARVLVLTQYSEKWAGGQEVFETSKQDEWRFIEVESPHEKVFKIVCNR